MNINQLSIENYEIQKEFEGNTLNKIYLVKDKQSQQLFIFKQIQIKDLRTQIREIQAQKNLNHKFIIRLVKFSIQKSSIDLLIEYASKGDLFDYINNLKTVREFTLLEMFYKLIIALDFIHLNGFIHRDIKPENILIGDDCEPKMADFGSSVGKQVIRNTFCGTSEYMAPEIYMREQQTEKVDIWAMGILLFEMCHNFTPFKGKNLFEIKDMIDERQLPFNPQIPLSIRQIIYKILRIDPKDRPTAREILAFPEFSGIDKELRKHIPKKNADDILNFEMSNGRILTREFKHKKTIENRKNCDQNKVDAKHKKLIKEDLNYFKRNFILPNNLDLSKTNKKNVKHSSSREYNYQNQNNLCEKPKRSKMSKKKTIDSSQKNIQKRFQNGKSKNLNISKTKQRTNKKKLNTNFKACLYESESFALKNNNLNKTKKKNNLVKDLKHFTKNKKAPNTEFSSIKCITRPEMFKNRKKIKNVRFDDYSIRSCKNIYAKFIKNSKKKNKLNNLLKKKFKANFIQNNLKNITSIHEIGSKGPKKNKQIQDHEMRQTSIIKKSKAFTKKKKSKFPNYSMLKMVNKPKKNISNIFSSKNINKVSKSSLSIPKNKLFQNQRRSCLYSSNVKSLKNISKNFSRAVSNTANEYDFKSHQIPKFIKNKLKYKLKSTNIYHTSTNLNSQSLSSYAFGLKSSRFLKTSYLHSFKSFH
jgi:serine/threonine protein kinase